MAIQIYNGKVYTFEWDGMLVGLRLPVVEEMIEITRARDAYFATITNERNQGDQAKLEEFRFLIGKTLACDPENRKNPWFAEDREKQQEFAKNGIFKDVAEDMPSSFFVAAAGFFNETLTRANLTDSDRKKFDKEMEDQAAGDSEAGNLETQESGMPTTPTAPSSADSSSESPSISNAATTQSESGDTTDS